MVEKKRVLIDAMGPELCSLGLLLSLCSVPICAFPRISTLICLSLVPVPIACSCILGWFQPPLCFLVPTRFTLFLAILFVCLTCLLVHTGLFLIGDLGRIVAMVDYGFAWPVFRFFHDEQSGIQFARMWMILGYPMIGLQRCVLMNILDRQRRLIGHMLYVLGMDQIGLRRNCIWDSICSCISHLCIC